MAGDPFLHINCHVYEIPPVLPVTATADAMVSSEMAGLGGLATLADGRTVWFQFRISLAETREHWNWVGSDMQKHIAVWELLAQFALTYCIHWALPHTRGPITCHQGTDNSAADATAAKKITMTVGMAQILTQYIVFMRRFHIFSRITHSPGHLNENADALSRFKDTSVPLNPLLQCRINWPDLVNQWAFTHSNKPRDGELPFVSASVKKKDPNPDLWWGVCSGWSCFDFVWAISLPLLCSFKFYLGPARLWELTLSTWDVYDGFHTGMS